MWERNQHIYQKYGYVLVEEKELVLEDDKEPNLVYSAMLKKYQKRGEGTKKEWGNFTVSVSRELESYIRYMYEGTCTLHIT